jgi:hypothetical protein
MRLGQALTAVADEVTTEQFQDLRRHIDPDWIEQGLHATGTASARNRRLPALHVVWLIIAMALFRTRAITDLVSKLNLAQPGKRSTVASSAVTKARKRLGADPMEWLFVTLGDLWGHQSAAQHRWLGLALYGMDGSTLRVADSKENARHFGYSKSRRGQSAYPLMRMVALMALRSHLLVAAVFGPYEISELAYAIDLWPVLPDFSLTVMDRCYVSAHVLLGLSQKGNNRHWLVRAKKNLRWSVLRRLGPKDYLIEMKVSKQARTQHPELPKLWVARAITYQRKGFRPQILLTSLVDETAYPAKEVATLYHLRWELEMGLNEVKTELLLQKESLRSKCVALVYQEMWGILLAYNLVRLEMERVAKEANVEPTRISFIATLRLMTDEWLWHALAAPGAVSQRLSHLRASIYILILPPRRSKRRYPREVKIKMSNYPCKRRAPTRKHVK